MHGSLKYLKYREILDSSNSMHNNNEDATRELEYEQNTT